MNNQNIKYIVLEHAYCGVWSLGGFSSLDGAKDLQRKLLEEDMWRDVEVMEVTQESERDL